MNYLDEINLIDVYINEHYSKPSINMNQKELRAYNSKKYALTEGLKKCSENPLKDPLTVLYNLKCSYDCKQYDAIQNIIFLHYESCIEAIDELYDFITKERNKI